MGALRSLFMLDGLSCLSEGRMPASGLVVALVVDDAYSEVGREMRRFLGVDSAVVGSVVVEALLRSLWATRDVLEALEMESSIL